jgi:hypothetical protein
LRERVAVTAQRLIDKPLASDLGHSALDKHQKVLALDPSLHHKGRGANLVLPDFAARAEGRIGIYRSYPSAPAVCGVLWLGRRTVAELLRLVGEVACGERWRTPVAAGLEIADLKRLNLVGGAS